MNGSFLIGFVIMEEGVYNITDPIHANSLTLKNRLNIAYKILDIVRFCHKQNICLGNLVLRNVMMFQSN
jgi:hypothetical protein